MGIQWCTGWALALPFLEVFLIARLSVRLADGLNKKQVLGGGQTALGKSTRVGASHV